MTTFSSIQEIKTAYQKKWSQQAQDNLKDKLSPKKVKSPSTKVDYDAIAQEVYDLAIARGIPQSQAIKVYRMIKRGK